METASERMTPSAPTIDPSRRSEIARGELASVGRAVDTRRLLLATDLSAASERAAEEAICLAVESSAELVVLSVIDPGRLRLPGGVFLRRVDQERARIETGVQTLVGRARVAGARATFLVWEGDPAEAILAASDAESVDVIVLGSHGRGLLGRFVLGSTSARVSEQARCRV
ncbi:MAG TPA: universal stress protein, partial [Candidatus Limnocylindrales bacterium]